MKWTDLFSWNSKCYHILCPSRLWVIFRRNEIYPCIAKYLIYQVDDSVRHLQKRFKSVIADVARIRVDVHDTLNTTYNILQDMNQMLHIAKGNVKTTQDRARFYVVQYTSSWIYHWSKSFFACTYWLLVIDYRQVG